MRPVNAAGVKTGEYKPVGDAYPLSCQVATEQIKVKSRRVETAGQIIASKTEITDTTGSLVLREWNAANLAFALSGTATDQAAAGASITDEVVTALPAGEYAPLLYRDVSAVAVKHTSGTPVYEEDTDYTLDEKLGMLTIIDGGAITATDELKVDYDYAAKTGYQVTMGDKVQIRVQILAHLYSEFADEHYVLELDSVVMAADQEINFISEAGTEGEQLQFGMTLETLTGQTSPGRVNGIDM